jgi:long-chain acyl-CoA synthetase
MRSIGAAKGDRVAVLAANCHRYVEAFIGLPGAGLVIVPLNLRLTPAELGSVLVDSGARFLITDREPGPLADLVERVIIWPDELESLMAATRAAVVLAGADPEIAESAVAESDLAALFYTGGTTGKPKGVMLTHANLVANSFHKTITVGLRSDDVFLAAPAMFHVAGVAPILSLISLGARVVAFPAFDPAGCLDAIAREKVTVMMPVPTMVAAMVEEQTVRPRDVSSLRLLGHAASPMSREAIRRAVATFPLASLAEFYGATETASIVTAQLGEEALIDSDLLGSCGQPAVGVSVRVTRHDGTECATGEIGAVVVRGRNVTPGYWNNPEATAEAFRNGWYVTGDLGYFDAESRLFLVDRAKDMIVTGGENVYCIEVEDALYRHPSVLEAAVFGIPHQRWGEAVHAVVVIRPGFERAELADELQTHVRGLVAGYKVPKSIDVRTDPLPKSGPGKILKRALRATFWSGHERTIG